MTAGAADEQSGPLRVFLVDDHAIVRSGIRGYLDLVGDMIVAGEARSGRQALDAIAAALAGRGAARRGADGPGHAGHGRHRSHPADQGPLARYRGGRGHQLRRGNEGAIGAAGRRGRYLLKDADADQVAAAIRAAAAGQCYLDPAVAKILADSLRAPRPAACTLMVRERDVLACIASGATDRQIARRLGVSERTARTHVSCILAKLGLASRTQAALWAVQHGLAVPRPPRA